MNQTSLYSSSNTKVEQQSLLDSESPESTVDKLIVAPSSQFQTHIERAEVIARYGEAFKKFDWLFYILAAFLLFILSLIASYFLGPIVSGVCTLMGTAALILLKKKAG